jgi:hypothetical protein
VIDFSPLIENSDPSILLSFDTASNVTDSSALHPQKHALPKTVTDDGIAIDFSPLPENA